ncbi:hypothetical protein B0H16DRAFT_1715332 [Mycena metata]|uniref:Uncharacterized protein n=1 Tax=Mycena metata TaxID=1033252 RepID=A0AAD7JS31_9AGAR|nr:hypothetical protein B0H16DRAFT_1715332 [Mycena metata]
MPNIANGAAAAHRRTNANANTTAHRTRSGAEYSPWADAIALSVPHIRLSELLRRRDEGPDSDTESLDDSDSDGDFDSDNSPRPGPTSPPPPPPRPSTFIRPAPPGHPPGTRLPNGLMPGSVIRVARAPPPPQKATAAQVKACRLLKKHAKDRHVRTLDREQQRVKAGSRLKGVARLRVRQTAPALHLDLSLQDYAAPVAASGWQAIRQDEADTQDHDLEEMLRTRPDMRVYEWDGYAGRCTSLPSYQTNTVRSFSTPTPAWGPDVAAKAAEGMEAAAEEIYTGPKWRRKAGLDTPIPCRGSHHAKHVGVAMGGGQRYPQNLAHATRNLLIFTRLFGLKSLQRIAGWTNGKHPAPFDPSARLMQHLGSAFHGVRPDLHEYYRATYAALCNWDQLQQHAKHIRHNLPERYSVFTTATYNFGPVTVTLPHIDFGNLAWGWCAVTALGNFDPDRGGHLVLWDLKLIIRFPPGSTILLPSAILRHSNLKIGRNETRFSFTQFTPAGIFRWVYNDFRTDKDVNAAKSTTEAEREQRKRHRASRWQEGVRMYRKWDGPVQ